MTNNVHHMISGADRALLENAEALFERGDYDGCVRLCGALQSRYGDVPVIRFMRGRCRHLLGELDAALGDYQAVIAFEPGYDDAYYQAGSILTEQAHYRAALDMLFALLRRRPGRSDAWALMGGTLSKLGEHLHAIECCREALRLNPEDAAAMANCSFAHAALNEEAEAKRWIESALALKPDVPAFHLHRASILLREGAFDEGWREWEWRLAKEDFRALNMRSMQPKRWKDEPLSGKTILVWCEQGLGDTIQCVRFLPALQAQGARVLFECQKDLMPVLGRFSGADVIFERFTESPEPFDYHVPLMSLPLHLRLQPDAIPLADGYLDPMTAAARAARLPIDARKFNIGVAWEGSRLSPVNHHRSGTPDMFSPFFGIPAAALYSLQHAVPKEALPSPIIHLGIRSMEELAGAIARMDLVVTIDTSIAHLAGAMGKPVWMLLSALPDWRWQLSETTSPWYASMRIFRQQTLGAWMPLTIDAAEQLRRHRSADSQSHNES